MTRSRHPMTAALTLKVLLPAGVEIEEPVEKVLAEAESGSVCLLPHHTDLATTLLPGLLAYRRPNGQDVCLSVDRGFLVKRGRAVIVAVRQAVARPDEDILRRTLRQRFEDVEESERRARAALARLGAA